MVFNSKRMFWLPFIILLSDGLRGSEWEFRLFLDGLLLEGSGSLSVGHVSGRFEFGEHGQTRWVERCVALLFLSLKIPTLLRIWQFLPFKFFLINKAILHQMLILIHSSIYWIYPERTPGTSSIFVDLSKWLSERLHFGKNCCDFERYMISLDSLVF